MSTPPLSVPEQPLSILHEVGQLYAFDAQDFAERFDVLREQVTTKSGRIKSFVDLLMGFECALKAHIALAGARDNLDPTATYQKIRRGSHNIARLAGDAGLLADKAPYTEIASRLGGYSVFLRYSLDATEAFFPWYKDRDQARFNYSSTIGSEAWIEKTRSMLNPVLDTALEVVTGEVGSSAGGLDDIFEHEKAMSEFFHAVTDRRAS
ncbi:hypothetical protein [Burkholderia glumae]|uniref:hypothetical protein n=1 Tax=Burkholderia glumae TaxID=337 RepID=UPI00215152B4|nr:hypothetical protein [Burkholderia glumae]